jgi:hypothetical protein
MENEDFNEESFSEEKSKEVPLLPAFEEDRRTEHSEESRKFYARIEEIERSSPVIQGPLEDFDGLPTTGSL